MPVSGCRKTRCWANLIFMYTEQQINEWKSKAEKWDTLEAKIAACYVDENGDELEDGDGGADLCDIGEIAAIAFGFL